MYMFFGLVGIIILFLFVMMIKHFRKSKSPSMKITTTVTNGDIACHGEPPVILQSNLSLYDNVSESNKAIQFYQQLEAEYYEINENLPHSSKLPVERAITETTSINVPTNDDYAHVKDTEETLSLNEISDSIISNGEEKNFYLDVV